MSGRDDPGTQAAPGPRSTGRLDSLLAAAAHGDTAAFEIVFAELSGPVYGQARAVLRDPGQAEEVAQEVLLEVWSTAVRYDSGRGGATAWALTIARRRAIDRVRSAAAASARERWTAAPPVPWDQVSETVEEILDGEHVRRCLRMLTGRQLEAIVLAYYGGYSHAQIALLLGVPLGTVKARIRDGLRHLRSFLQEGVQAEG